MDTRKLTEIFRATIDPNSIDPNQRQQAEEQLAQVCLKHGRWPWFCILIYMFYYLSLTYISEE